MGSGHSKHEDGVKSERQKSPVLVVESTAVPKQAPGSTRRREEGSTATEEEASSTESVGGGCPMKQSDGSYSYDWLALFRPNFPHGPKGSRPMTEQQAREKTTKADSEEQTSNSKDETTSGCPVKHQQYNVYSQLIDPKNNMPSVASQLPAPQQSKPLSTDRVTSRIPKGGSTEGTTWAYPSPQMFYNALSRKGKLESTDEDEIANVVAIHNNMNEKTWLKALEWEKVLSPATGPPKLLKFCGRPHDLSPKAMFKHYCLGHPLPYDRHDWTVLRGDGTTVRYVIDYYYDESRARESRDSAMPDIHDADGTPSLLVDLRPAIDTPWQIWNRLVAMPYARHISKETSFEPLPMRPTADMKSQVQTSVQVWKNAQAASQQKDDDVDREDVPEISDEEAKELARSFARMLGDCRKEQDGVDRCQSEQECSRASIDLTICMSRAVCPLQHEALVTALTVEEESNSSDATIEAALERVNDCVVMKTNRHALAKLQHPS